MTTTERINLAAERLKQCIDMHMLGGNVVREGCKQDVDVLFAGALAERKAVIAEIEDWCRADPECSFNPVSSAWRLFDYLKLLEQKS